MSWVHGARTALRCGKLAAVLCKPTSHVTTALPRAASINKVVSKSLVNHTYEISILPYCIQFTNVPPMMIKKEISDPLSVQIKKTPTLPSNVIDFSLPKLIDKEVIDPQENVLEKRAARLIVIRRAKMKKHKWRKLQKRMKFHFAKKRQKRELKKEKEFQAVLLAQVKEAERFDVESYVAGRIKTAHWEKPITRVRGFFAPDWVIRDHLQHKDNQRKLNERIEDCLRMKKVERK